MLSRAGQARVKRVHVHIDQVGHVAADHHPLEEVHVVEIVDDLCRLIEVGRGRIPLVVGYQIDHVDRGPGSAEMDLAARQVQVVPGIAGVQRDVARGHR